MKDIYGCMDGVTLVSKHDYDKCLPKVHNDIPTCQGSRVIYSLYLDLDD